jgi:hypothetical protein
VDHLWSVDLWICDLIDSRMMYCMMFSVQGSGVLVAGRWSLNISPVFGEIQSIPPKEQFLVRSSKPHQEQCT